MAWGVPPSALPLRTAGEGSKKSGGFSPPGGWAGKTLRCRISVIAGQYISEDRFGIVHDTIYRYRLIRPDLPRIDPVITGQGTAVKGRP